MLGSLLQVGLAGFARAQTTPASESIVATIEGSTYRATQVRELPDGALQIQTRGGRQITIPASRLATVWSDAETARQPPELIVRTTCVRALLEGPIIRDLVFVNQTAPPLRARILHIYRDRLLHYQRLDATVAEQRPWAEVDEIRRPQGLLDACKVAPQPEPEPEQVTKASGRPAASGQKGKGLIITGSIFLGIGLLQLLPGALVAAQPSTASAPGLSPYLLLGLGCIPTAIGVSLLIPGLVQYGQ